MLTFFLVGKGRMTCEESLDTPMLYTLNIYSILTQNHDTLGSSPWDGYIWENTDTYRQYQNYYVCSKE